MAGTDPIGSITAKLENISAGCTAPSSSSPDLIRGSAHRHQDKDSVENCFAQTPYLPVVIAGRASTRVRVDPVISPDSGGCGNARIKSGHDEVGMDCLCPGLILVPMGIGLVRTRERFAASNAKTRTAERLQGNRAKSWRRGWRLPVEAGIRWILLEIHHRGAEARRCRRNERAKAVDVSVVLRASAPLW
jgi:hypothetical protein